MTPMVHDVCILCLRPIRAERFGVNFDSETSQPIAPDVVTNGSGLMPIGPRCRRKLLAGWVTPWPVMKPAER